MKARNKWLGAAALSLSIVLGLAGCGQTGDQPKASGAGASTAEATKEAPKKQANLDFVWFSDGNEGEVMKGLLKQYEEKNPNVKVNLVEVAYADMNTKLKTMISGGNPPALARMSDTSTFFNQALDLSPYVGDINAFTGQFMDTLKPYYVTKDNKVIAVPLDVTANGLIYNKTLFKKAGVSVPTSPDQVWTWSEFEAALKQVMEKGGAKYGLVWDFSTHRWTTMLYQFGGSMFSADGTKGALNTDNAVKAVDFFTKLHKDGIMPTSVWLGGDNPNNLFRSGTVAAHLSGNWVLGNYKTIDSFEWGVTYMPKEAIRSSVPGGKFLMAFKGSKVEKEAADLIKFLSTKEANAKFSTDSLFMSPRKDNAKLDYAFGKEMFEVFSNELAVTPASAGADWSNVLANKFQADLKTGIVEVLGNKTTSKAMLEKMNKTVDTIISENK
jgi:alpha-1,4-digalacturonate transport system substrate-binding protein